MRRRCGLLRPSPDGRRRPLLGLRSLHHTADLAPFAVALREHLQASALLPKAAEVDASFVDLLIGCEFVSTQEAEAMLRPHWRATTAGIEGAHAQASAPAAASPSTTRAEDRPLFPRCTPHETL